jgi:hypothetical protein
MEDLKQAQVWVLKATGWVICKMEKILSVPPLDEQVDDFLEEYGFDLEPIHCHEQGDNFLECYRNKDDAYLVYAFIAGIKRIYFAEGYPQYLQLFKQFQEMFLNEIKIEMLKKEMENEDVF